MVHPALEGAILAGALHAAATAPHAVAATLLRVGRELERGGARWRSGAKWLYSLPKVKEHAHSGGKEASRD